jgi:hypothetical protein
MAAQFFKGDPTELKFYNAGKPALDNYNDEKDAFFEDAFNCFLLGDLLYDTNRSPLANAIPKAIFRESFSTVFDAFLVAGSAESYLTVFRKVFGEDVEVTFNVPGPGKLEIQINATTFETYNFVARRIENNAYVTDQVITQDGDHIVFQTVKGFESQYDLEQMLFELVPDGIWTVITLTIEGE